MGRTFRVAARACLAPGRYASLPPAGVDRRRLWPRFSASAEGQWGEWRQQDGTIEAEAVGTYGYAFLDLERGDLLMETVIEMDAGTHSAGFLLETDDTLGSGYSIAIEPLRRRVVFSRWPQPMDPLWQRLAPGEIAQPTVDNPLVARHLPIVPTDNSYVVRLLRKESMLECFVGDQVVLTFRIYERGARPFGLFVQEGAARFRDLTAAAG